MTSNDGRRVTFDKKDLRGSRLRCLILTSGSLEQVGHRLTRLVEPYAEIHAQRNTWMPRGFLDPKESTLELWLERQWQVEFQNLELYLVRQFNQSRSCQ